MKILLLFLAWLALGAQAGTGDAGKQIPSCFAANGLVQPAVDRELFLMIDQTTLLDRELSNLLARNVDALLVPGTAFTVIRYSAYSQGRYTNVPLRGVLEAPLNERKRNATGVRVLKNLDGCLAGQLAYGRKAAAAAIGQALAEASGELDRSDIIATLRETSGIVRQSAAPVRLVLIVSDMLEHSALTSFYAHHAIRPIQPGQELAKLEKSGHLADFGGARVFVLGAGLIADDTRGRRKIYRDPTTMRRLGEFWSAYFEKSRAHLIEFGQPALLNPVH